MVNVFKVHLNITYKGNRNTLYQLKGDVVCPLIRQQPTRTKIKKFVCRAFLILTGVYTTLFSDTFNKMTSAG